MAPTNQAAWLRNLNEPLQVGPAESGKPGPGEILVENHAVAVNPVDWMMQYGAYPTGFLPNVLGNDIAGEVVDVGEGVSDFSKGQRVLAHCIGLGTKKPEHGGFQNFTVVPTLGACPIPDNMSYEDACVLPLAISTAALGLFHKDNLSLPAPSHKVEDSGNALLVWGGSSSVGSAAIQLAVAAGLTVIATASKRNLDFCSALGASEVFDYHSPGIIGDLTAAMQKYGLAGAFDGKILNSMRSMMLNRLLAIATRDTQLSVAQVLTQLGGGKMALVLPAIDELPATVDTSGSKSPQPTPQELLTFCKSSLCRFCKATKISQSWSTGTSCQVLSRVVRSSRRPSRTLLATESNIFRALLKSCAQGCQLQRWWLPCRVCV